MTVRKMATRLHRHLAEMLKAHETLKLYRRKVRETSEGSFWRSNPLYAHSVTDRIKRQYSYAIRHGCYPREVVALFNIAQPSTGHAKRICRILRSESWKQVGRYRDVLWIKCHALSVKESSAERNYKLHLRTAAQYREVFWQQTRMTLAKNNRRNEADGSEAFVPGFRALPRFLSLAHTHILHQQTFLNMALCHFMATIVVIKSGQKKKIRLIPQTFFFGRGLT
ncbi:hypothetical protein HPB47_013737 [Ixodes persulcatus]|uniref:Uncharacterized protein n=1 Tax=Ixodes persulcatus TaxID=34615 RepID=A0AC60QXS2_IXOPE|nr:hypothetical protein HPB47_013737 [Ixodes persulcatus]